LKNLGPLERLEPYLVEKIWGGRRLKEIYNTAGSNFYGESWIISRLIEGPSHTKFNNDTSCNKLNELIDHKDLPYLVKYIDTKSNLSVQVHPDDEFAKLHENSLGKTECWVVLDAAPGAGVYLGLKPGVNKDALKDAIDNDVDVSELLNFYPVKRGDFFFVPAETIHAIGGGVFLIEVQQSSGITYRTWDWNRKDHNGQKRELHINKALEVINFEEARNQRETFQIKEGVLSFLNPSSKIEKNILAKHDCFQVEIIQLIQGEQTTIKLDSKRASSLVCLSGKVEAKRSDSKTVLSDYEVAILPLEYEKSVTLKAYSEKVEIIWIY
jgi:mannose-6-phosphate isomerase